MALETEYTDGVLPLSCSPGSQPILLLTEKYFYYFHLILSYFMRLIVLPESIKCTPCGPGAHRDQKKASGSQTGLTEDCEPSGAGNQTKGL